MKRRVDRTKRSQQSHPGLEDIGAMVILALFVFVISAAVPVRKSTYEMIGKSWEVAVWQKVESVEGDYMQAIRITGDENIPVSHPLFGPVTDQIADAEFVDVAMSGVFVNESGDVARMPFISIDDYHSWQIGDKCDTLMNWVNDPVAGCGSNGKLVGID